MNAQNQLFILGAAVAAIGLYTKSTILALAGLGVVAYSLKPGIVPGSSLPPPLRGKVRMADVIARAATLGGPAVAVPFADVEEAALAAAGEADFVEYGDDTGPVSIYY